MPEALRLFQQPVSAVHSENRDAPIRFDHNTAQPHIGRSKVAATARGRGLRKVLGRAVQRFIGAKR
jgi:hypothetical protein